MDVDTFVESARVRFLAFFNVRNVYVMVMSLCFTKMLDTTVTFTRLGVSVLAHDGTHKN